MAQINLDPAVFYAAGIEGKVVTIFSKKALTEWPESLTYSGHTYNFEAATTVPKVNQDHYLGAAEYTRNTTCIYDEAWQGTCGKVCIDGTDFCLSHLEEKCSLCGGQSNHNCDSTMGLVCGSPLCENRMCIIKHRSGHLTPNKLSPIDSRVIGERWFVNHIQSWELNGEELEELASYILGSTDKTISLYQNLHNKADGRKVLKGETKEQLPDIIKEIKKNSLARIEEAKDQHIYLTDLFSRGLEVRSLGKKWNDVYDK